MCHSDPCKSGLGGGTSNAVFLTKNLYNRKLDKKLIEPNLLTKKEINWINSYHKKVYRKLRIFLNPIETKWLKQECADL